jgi:peptidoglycan/xylan/chitin deacetylase (PgdA/CDA1 family)
MNRLSILMYHALYATDAQFAAIDPEDRPYAVSAHAFARQLDLLVAAQIPVISPQALEQPGAPLPGGVLLTFDDGHASNAELALPLLRARGLSALFFITTDFIGERPGFCSWDQVRALVRNGMTVGAHGQTHRFLSELPDAALRAELQNSRSRLAHELQTPVRQMSFPGGRYDSRCLKLAREAGFCVLHGSAVGALPARALLPRQRPLPRLAIRGELSDRAFVDLARAAPLPLLRAQALWHAKTWGRRLIGNQRYHRLYTRAKGARHAS